MAGVVTDVGQMEAAANHVETVNAQLQSTINGLKGRCEESSSAWAGGAQNAFQALMVRYADASRRQQESLADIAVKIRENGKGYDAAEQANQDAIHSAGNSGSLDI
ncbi:WXG100 family type VII secretion target [Rhodococcus marinonascens]|uniref:WXG100 family type VII secretion target n=1 Tax=Rhodococcus marinonascens TaxID=38311 RepID=UPI00093366A1|nr:WXG100 family type VII secretion target [Rhodococcus marinonascens]